MRTPEHFAIAIRELQKSASDSVINHYQIQSDGSFSSDIMMVVAQSLYPSSFKLQVCCRLPAA